MRQTVRHTLTTVLCLLLAAGSVSAHPKPGAHADVRITITKTGVRVDLLMNLMFVDGLVQAPRARLDDVLPGEEAALHAAVRQYFATSAGEIGGLAPRAGDERTLVMDRPNFVQIDGLPVAAIEREFRIVRPEPETRPGFEQNPLLLIPQVQLVLEYPCKAAPAQVRFVWGTFPLDFLAQDRLSPPPVAIEALLVAQGRIEQIVLTRDEPEHLWHDPGARLLPPAPTLVAQAPESVLQRVPVVSVAVASAWILGASYSLLRSRRLKLGPVVLLVPAALTAWATLPYAHIDLSRPLPPPSEEEAIATFQTLHANMYRAFDYTSESEIYDALARSIDGGLLDTLYTHIYTSLIMFEEGGAVSRVEQVMPVESTYLMADPNAGARERAFRVRSRWRVKGVVYHWGHSHTRLNEYLAEYRVSATAAGWRITAMLPLEQLRVDPTTGAMEPEAAPVEATPSSTPWRPDR